MKQGLRILDFAAHPSLSDVRVWVPRDPLTGEQTDVERCASWSTLGPIEQWALALSDMRESKWEHSTRLFALARTSHELVELLQREVVEPYQEMCGVIEDWGRIQLVGTARSFAKTFRKGGPLEWANPTASDGEDEIRPSLTLAQVLRRAEESARESYERMTRDALDMTKG